MESDLEKIEVKRQQSIERLINWSKWLISINFVAATGCIVALKNAGPAVEKVGIFFFLAILSFSVSVLCSTRFVFVMAQDGLMETNNVANMHLWLAKLQWILFAIGLICVLIWIAFMSKVLS